jgi:hypothetical protein
MQISVLWWFPTGSSGFVHFPIFLFLLFRVDNFNYPSQVGESFLLPAWICYWISLVSFSSKNASMKCTLISFRMSQVL